MKMSKCPSWMGVAAASACLLIGLTAHAGDADMKALMERVAALEAKNGELERRATAEKDTNKAVDEAVAKSDEQTSTSTNITTGGQKITVGGYIDTSFEFNFNQPSNMNNNFRVFDNSSNGFDLHLAELTFDGLPSKPGEAGFRLDLAFGSDVRVFKPVDKFVQNSQARLNDFVDNDFKQAYIEYIVPFGCPGSKKGITVDMGKFVTWCGYETIEAADNINSSRSLLFGYAIPFTHTGLRASYKVFDSECNKWTIGAGIVNGWDNVQDQNKSKTGIFNSDWTPTKWFEFVLNGVVGYENTVDNRDDVNAAVLAAGDPTVAFDPTTPGVLASGLPVSSLRVGNTYLGTLDGGRTARLFNPQRGGARGLIDTTLIFKPLCGKDDLILAFNGDFARDSGASWYGGAAYAKWQFAKSWYLGVRGEYFNDSKGVRTGIGQQLYEGTVTIDWALTSALHTRLEFRNDHSNKGVFGDKTVPDPTTLNPNQPFAKEQQSTIMMSWLYKF